MKGTRLNSRLAATSRAKSTKKQPQVTPAHEKKARFQYQVSAYSKGPKRNPSPRQNVRSDIQHYNIMANKQPTQQELLSRCTRNYTQELMKQEFTEAGPETL